MEAILRPLCLSILTGKPLTAAMVPLFQWGLPELCDFSWKWKNWMVLLHLAAPAQGLWLTVSLFPGKPFLGLVPSLVGHSQSLLWPHKMVWPGLNIWISRCNRILLFLRILGPPFWSLAEGWRRQLISSLDPGSIVTLRWWIQGIRPLAGKLWLFPGDIVACLRELG
jgi:hypothetical protein